MGHDVVEKPPFFMRPAASGHEGSKVVHINYFTAQVRPNPKTSTLSPSSWPRPPPATRAPKKCTSNYFTAQVRRTCSCSAGCVGFLDAMCIALHCFLDAMCTAPALLAQWEDECMTRQGSRDLNKRYQLLCKCVLAGGSCLLPHAGESLLAPATACSFQDASETFAYATRISNMLLAKA